MRKLNINNFIIILILVLPIILNAQKKQDIEAIKEKIHEYFFILSIKPAKQNVT